MSDGIEVDVRGIREAVRVLNRYSNDMSDVVVTRAVKLGADTMKAAIKRVTPKSTKGKFPGRLKRSIISRKSKIHSRQRDGVIGYYIVAKKKGKTDNPNNGYYAGWIQSGWEMRGKYPPGRRRTTADGLQRGRKTLPSGVFVAPNPFIKNAVAANRGNVENLMTTAIERGSSELVSRLGL